MNTISTIDKNSASAADAAKNLPLDLRNIDAGERQDEVLELLQASMASGTERWSRRELWQWKHVENPFGRSLVLIAEAEDGRIAGLRAFMKWRLRSGDTRIEAYRPVDTATHPDFRRLGIFSRLTLQAVEDAREDGTQLIFNTPNSMSVSGYLKMGWKQAGIATPVLKVNSYPKTGLKLASRKIGQKLGIGGNATTTEASVPEALRPETAITPDFEQLIDRHIESQGGRLVTDYSVPYLNWRYATNPLYSYAVITDRDAGELTGACIVRMALGSTLNTLVFEEFLLSDPNRKNIGRLIDTAFDTFKPDVASAFAPPGTATAALLRESGFRWNSKSRINLVARPLNGEFDTNPESISNWAIGMSELEIF